MNWFRNLLPSRIRTDGTSKKSIPEGVWTSCPACKSVLYRAELERNLFVCLKCGFHLRISARTRVGQFLDEQPREELGSEIEPVDFLKFRDSKRYRDRLAQAQKRTGEDDALVAVRGEVEGRPVVVCAFEFDFMGGSMGSVVGERFAVAAQRCAGDRVPLVSFSASGGARMQEGLISLMQMAKTSVAIQAMAEARVPYISVLTDPTMGGVSASLAMLGDVVIAEPGALIGFAGPRVIEQTVRETLPEGFQRSEFLLEHGAIDRVVDRRELRAQVVSLIDMLTLDSTQPD